MAHHSNELCYCCYFIRFVNFIYAKHFHWLDKCLAWILLLFLCFWSVLMCVFLILTISLNRVTHRIYMRCLNIIQSTFHPRNSVMLCLRFSSVSVLLWYFYIFYSKSIVASGRNAVTQSFNICVAISMNFSSDITFATYWWRWKRSHPTITIDIRLWPVETKWNDFNQAIRIDNKHSVFTLKKICVRKFDELFHWNRYWFWYHYT